MQDGISFDQIWVGLCRRKAQVLAMATAMWRFLVYFWIRWVFASCVVTNTVTVMFALTC